MLGHLRISAWGPGSVPGSVQVPGTRDAEALAGARGRPQPEPLPAGESVSEHTLCARRCAVLVAEGRAEPLGLWGLTSRGDSLRQRHGGSVPLLGCRTVGQARARGRWAVLGWSAKAPLAEGRWEWRSRRSSSRCEGPGQKWLWVYRERCADSRGQGPVRAGTLGPWDPGQESGFRPDQARVCGLRPRRPALPPPEGGKRRSTLCHCSLQKAWGLGTQGDRVRDGGWRDAG